MGFTFTVVLNAYTEQFAQSASQLESVKMHPCGLLSKTYLEEHTLSHTGKDQGKRTKMSEATASKGKQAAQRNLNFYFLLSILHSLCSILMSIL